MSRTERERAILRLVEEETIRTQTELAEELARRGFPVAQSTVSRDVRRLGLVRVPQASGVSRYARPEAAEGASTGSRERLDRLVRDEVVAVEPGGPLVLLRTPPGLASAVAAALDEADLPGLVGTLAGDDTVLAVASDEEARLGLLDRLRTPG